MKKCWEYESKNRPTFDELYAFFRRDESYINMQVDAPGKVSMKDGHWLAENVQWKK